MKYYYVVCIKGLVGYGDLVFGDIDIVVFVIVGQWQLCIGFQYGIGIECVGKGFDWCGFVLCVVKDQLYLFVIFGQYWQCFVVVMFKGGIVIFGGFGQCYLCLDVVQCVGVVVYFG